MVNTNCEVFQQKVVDPCYSASQLDFFKTVNHHPQVSAIADVEELLLIKKLNEPLD